MEALSSFGFTDSAKAAVPDTDVLEARMAVNEVKEELESFSGKVAGEVKKVETQQKGFLERIASSITGGGSSAAEKTGDRNSARNSSIVFGLVKTHGDKIVVPTPFFVGNPKLMKSQIEEMAKDFIFIKSSVSHKLQKDARGDADDLQKFLTHVAADILRSDKTSVPQHLPENQQNLIVNSDEDITDYKQIKTLTIIDTNRIDRRTEISLEKLIDIFVNQDDSTQKKFAAISNAAANPVSGPMGGFDSNNDDIPNDVLQAGTLADAARRTGKLEDSESNSVLRGYSKLIVKKTLIKVFISVFILAIIAYVVYYMLGYAAIEEARKQLESERAKKKFKIAQNALLKFMGETSVPDMKAQIARAYENIENRTQFGPIMSDFENFQVLDGLVKSKQLLQAYMGYVAIYIKKNPSKIDEIQSVVTACVDTFKALDASGMLENIKSMGNESISKLNELVTDYVPMINFAMTNRASLESFELPDDEGVNSFVGDDNGKNLAVDKMGKAILMSDRFLEKIACDTQMPGMVVLLSSLREVYGKDLLEKALPIDKKSSVYTAVEVGPKTHRVYFHGGCAQLENVPASTNNMTSGDSPADAPSDADTDELDSDDDLENYQSAAEIERQRKTLAALKKLQHKQQPAQPQQPRQPRTRTRSSRTRPLSNYLDYTSLV